MRKYFAYMRRPYSYVYDFAPDPSEFRYLWGKFTNIFLSVCEVFEIVYSIDQITIKTPSPKCHLFWFIVIVYRLEIQSVMLVFFTPLLNLRHSTLFTGSSPPPPFPLWISTGICIYKVCDGGGGDRVVWIASTGVVLWVFDQIQNLQSWFTTPNKNLDGEGTSADKHLPPSPFTGPNLRKGDILLWCLCS